MRKKIIFVMESLGIGGAEKSLVTLLSQLDYSKYDVDLFLFQQKGEFIELLPEKVNLIETSKDFENFILNPKQSLRELIKRKKVKLILYKLLEIGNIALNKFLLKKEYIGWQFTKKSIDTFNKEYDVAIGFLEKKSIYFIVDKIKAKKKIGWIHIDYEKIEHNHKLDNIYFEKLNNIVTVSEHCKEVLIKEFPKYKGKIEYIQNIISPKLINSMANNVIDDIKFSEKYTIICTVCRLTIQKGIDIAIECCEKLIKRGLIFKWIVIGDGSERENLQRLINEKGLQDIFILMGSRSNPYPYINICDLYVQPSRWEGFGITVAESKVLNKPIVVSDIPEFIEQIEDDKTGLIYINIDEMVIKIESLLTKNEKRHLLTDNLKKINMNNYSELKKIEKLID